MSEALPAVAVSRLESRHDRTAFDCGEPKLNIYIQTLASQHEKRGIGRTFVATETGSAKVLGFYTLVASSVLFQHLPDDERVPRYPVPVLKLAQLAVDSSVKGRRLGEFLLLDCLARAERISREAAVFAVEVDVLSESAVAFYTKYQFSPLKDDKLHLYLPMKLVAKLGLNQ